MNPISYKLSGIAHIAPTIGRDPYKNPSSIPDCNLILPKDTPDVAVSTVGFSLGASQIQETVKQLFAWLQSTRVYIPGEIPTWGAKIRPNPTDRMGYYDRWSLAHAAVTTTALNARIAMTPNGQLWREITPADLPPPIKDPCKIVLSTWVQTGHILADTPISPAFPLPQFNRSRSSIWSLDPGWVPELFR